MKEFKTPNRINESHKQKLYNTLLRERQNLSTSKESGALFKDWLEDLVSKIKTMKTPIKIMIPAGSLAVVVILAVVIASSPVTPKKNDNDNVDNQIVDSCDSIDCFLQKANGAAAQQLEKLSENFVHYQRTKTISKGDFESHDSYDESIRDKGLVEIHEEWSKADKTSLSKRYSSIENTEDVIMEIPHDDLLKVYESLSRIDEMGMRNDMSTDEYIKTLPDENDIPDVSEFVVYELEHAMCIDKENKEYAQSDNGRRYHAADQLSVLSEYQSNIEYRKKIIEDAIELKDIGLEDLGNVYVSEFSQELRGISLDTQYGQGHDISSITEYYFDPQTYNLKKTVHRYYQSAVPGGPGEMNSEVIFLIEEDKFIPQEDESVQDIFDPVKEGLIFTTWSDPRITQIDYSYYLLNEAEMELGCYLFDSEKEEWYRLSKEQAIPYVKDQYGDYLDEDYTQRRLNEFYPE